MKQILINKSLCLAVSVLFASGFAFSQEQGFSSQVDLSLNQDSNVYRTTSEVDDSFLLVSPTLQYVGTYGKQAMGVRYIGGYAAFSDNTDLGYAEHDVLLNADLDHNHKFSSEFTLRYRDQIEAPGSNNSVTTQVDEYNQFSNTDFSASLIYGTLQSKGQLILQYAHSNFDYSNNAQEFRSYSRDSLSGDFFYRVGANTRLLFEANAYDLQYENTELTDLTSFQTQYLAGVEWSPSAATSTSLRVGYLDVDYDDSELSDLSGLSYAFDLGWRPSSATLVQASATRQARESAELLTGGYINNEYTLSASHDLSYKTNIYISYVHSNYDFDSVVTREDTRKDLTAKLNFQSKNWLNLYLEYKVDKRDSSLEFYNYNASILSIGVVASFN